MYKIILYIKYMSHDILNLYVIIIGDSAVGKTYLFENYTKKITSGTSMTIGVNFGMKKIKSNNRTIELHLVDTSGSTRLKSITTDYYNKVIGAFICYNIYDRTSFKNVIKWYKDFKKNAEKKTYIILCGLKWDHTIRERVVSVEEGKKLGVTLNCIFTELAVDNITEVHTYIDKLVRRIDNKLTRGLIRLDSNGIKLINSSTSTVDDTVKSKFCCCF